MDPSARVPIPNDQQTRRPHSNIVCGAIRETRHVHVHPARFMIIALDLVFSVAYHNNSKRDYDATTIYLVLAVCCLRAALFHIVEPRLKVAVNSS